MHGQNVEIPAFPELPFLTRENLLLMAGYLETGLPIGIEGHLRGEWDTEDNVEIDFVLKVDEDFPMGSLFKTRVVKAIAGTELKIPRLSLSDLKDPSKFEEVKCLLRL